MFLPRHNDWMIRAWSPAGSTVPLGSPEELWIEDPSTIAGIDRLRPLVAADDTSDLQVSRRLAMDLLPEVVAAAGGVEHAWLGLQRTMAETRAITDQAVVPYPNPPVPQGYMGPTVTDALYQFTNLLTWSRSVVERVDRAGPSKSPRQGLLPMLRPGPLRDEVTRLVRQLRTGSMAETRWLTNFVLHGGLLAAPNSPVHILADGTPMLPVPPVVTGPVDHSRELRGGQPRDGIAFAEEVWNQVGEFIDALLAAFDRAVPQRYRR